MWAMVEGTVQCCYIHTVATVYIRAHCRSHVQLIVTLPVLNVTLKRKTLAINSEMLLSYVAIILIIHYQLALTYVPVHLSLYAAEQGARF